MATKRDEIVKFCEKLLNVGEFKDVFHNGLQVEGSEEVFKIVTGVTFSLELAQKAVESEAQMILVHHGVSSFNFGDKFRVTGYFKKRLELLLKNDISLVGFHLPLDAHSEIGNNALICRALGVEKLQKFDDGQYGEIGFIGQLKAPVRIEDFVKSVGDKLETESLLVAGGPQEVSQVGVVSGGAGDDFKEAFLHGADTFITGEIREHNYWEARELGVNLIAAGHYNTERLGIQALGEKVSKEFGIKVEFVDFSCPV